MINGDSVMKSTNLPSADEEAVRRGVARRGGGGGAQKDMGASRE